MLLFGGMVRSEAPLHRFFVLPATRGVLSCCWPEGALCVGLLNIKLVQRQLVHERPHQVVRGKVEDEPEKDGDGKSGESFPEDGEQEQGETQALQGVGDKQSALYDYDPNQTNPSLQRNRLLNNQAVLHKSRMDYCAERRAGDAAACV